MIDYERLARQIALPEIGAAGQRLLGESRPQLGSELARELHARAVGATPRVPAFEAPPGAAPLALGCAALECIEAARRALAQDASDTPAALLARLSVDDA